MHNRYLKVPPLGNVTRQEKIHPFAILLAGVCAWAIYPVGALVLVNIWLAVTVIRLKKKHSEELGRTEKHYQTAVSNVSHRLAAPLASIHLGLQSLSDDDLNAKERSAEIERLVRQSRWASRTCRRLFQLSQWAQEPPEARPEDLSILDHLLEVLEVFEDSIVDQNIELSLDGFQDRTVKTDPGFLRDALGAVLENVVDHAGGKCKLSISTRTDERQVWVEVKDSGKGARHDALQRALSPYRLGETTGLGLSLTRKLIESQGGKLVVESGPGEGFKVSFSIPKS